jgi:hypothetical protein
MRRWTRLSNGGISSQTPSTLVEGVLRWARVELESNEKGAYIVGFDERPERKQTDDDR